jgi:FtsP/CotA-like multicopper oxidase with cupredoxin domain
VGLVLLVPGLAGAGGIDVPTGADPSPLFGAQPFTVKMLRFEEFGVRGLPETDCPTCAPLPGLPSCGGHPDWASLDSFLTQPLNPLPTPRANQSQPNPWESRIESCVRPLDQTYAEGRPPGEFWAHQRWGEFKPRVYFQSAQAGAHPNAGMRDGMQMHGYSRGEFGPGGLYHDTFDGAGVVAPAHGFQGTTADIEVRLHPKMPPQDPRALWTFDGTLPPKLLMARYGFPILFRHYNALPIDPAANYGFGLHTLSTHEHNGHNPAESDGYTQSFFFPGQFYDYRWPMILAGHDSINTGPNPTDPRAATPDGQGGTIKIPGDWRETMSTHWFHDHMLDFTAQNVYKGNAAMMNYYSAVDRGHEGLDCHYADSANVNLCLPSGTALDWGNRDYDVNLLVADKAWDADGQLFFNIFNLDGFLGDQMTVNWLYKPYFEVRARRYRLRILNGSVSRYFKIALVDESGQRVPFHMIANDGNIMEHAVAFPNAESADLPTQAIAERYDIIVDFSQFQEGDKVYMVNLIEHENGKGPNEAIPLADVLSGAYQGDPAVGKFLEFRVKSHAGVDSSMNPADYVEGGKKMIPLPGFTATELANARHRTFEFGRSSGTDTTPWTIKTDGGQGFGMDPRRLSAAPNDGDVEIWHIENGGGGWSHPIHIHFEEGQILRRDGKPPPVWEKWARKDVFRVGRMSDSSDTVEVALRFREFLGTYMEHCHNTQHEDHAMLLRWDVENPGETVVMPTPIPSWDGIFYENSVTLPTYKVGDVDAAEDFDLTGLTFSCTANEDPLLSCADGIDNDCDGSTDAADVDCGVLCVATELPVELTCDDGIDNDCDTAVDSGDPDCTPVCVPDEAIEISCTDGVDNDCDTAIDGDDPDCSPSCDQTEGFEISCADGVDNDCDSAVDLDDPDCQDDACTLAQVGDSCVSDLDCCSNRCVGLAAGRRVGTCR